MSTQHHMEASRLPGWLMSFVLSVRLLLKVLAACSEHAQRSTHASQQAAQMLVHAVYQAAPRGLQKHVSCFHTPMPASQSRSCCWP